jgi:small acid-soluble spore protein H (minor)
MFETRKEIIISRSEIFVDVKRVKQILSSPEEIDVRYHGVSVWIESCDEEGRTATVHTRGRDNDRRTVPVAELEEA